MVLREKEKILASRRKGKTTVLAVLLFIILVFIIVLFVYYGYDLIKTLFEKGFRGVFS
jgi:hypothetical protein